MRPSEPNPVHSVRYMGTLPRRHTDVWAMVGQDGGQSIDLGDRTLFVFSDTLLSARTGSRPDKSVPAVFRRDVGTQGVFLANCAGLSDGTTVRDAAAKVDYYLDAMEFPREILPAGFHERALEIRFWPEHGIFVDGFVYLYYIGIQTVDPSTIWGFRNAGCGIARLDPCTGECEKLTRDGDWRLWRSGGDLHFGVQVLREGDDCYVFGSMCHYLFSHAVLAKVKASELGNVEAYTYLAAGDRWSESLDEAVSLGPCAGDYSVSWNAHLGRYLMLYIDPYEKILTMRTAEQISGPYSEPRPIVAVPHAETTEMVYLGFEHPRFSPDSGRTVFLSYCQPHFTNNALLALKFR